MVHDYSLRCPQATLCIGFVALHPEVRPWQSNAFTVPSNLQDSYTMLEEYLALPFDTEVLGVVVQVVRLDLHGDNDIVAICTRGRERQAIRVLDLPLPSPRPAGSEWIETYRHWAGG